MTTSPGKLQLNKTIYSSLLAALHLKVASTTRVYASHCTWRQQRQTLLVDGALSGARRTGPRTTSCFWTRLPVDLTIHVGDSPPQTLTADTDLPVIGSCRFNSRLRNRVYILLPHGGSMEWQSPTPPKIGRIYSIINTGDYVGWKRSWLHKLIAWKCFCWRGGGGRKTDMCLHCVHWSREAN